MFADDSAASRNIVVNGLEYSIVTENSVSVKNVVTDSEVVSIPSKININDKEYAVTGIMQSAFSNNNVISSIKLPETISTIGALSFTNCYQLRSLAIPSSVKKIGISGLSKLEILSQTPLEVVSFLGSDIPEGNLNYIFESPYIKKIAVPTEAAANYEYAYPSLKKDRIKVEIFVNPDQIEPLNDFSISPDFVYVPDALYSDNINNSRVEIPNEATVYIKSGESVALFMNYTLIGKLIYKINGVEFKPEKTGYLERTGPTFGYGFQIIEGLTQDCKIEIALSPEHLDSVESVLEDFPATFAVYSTDGVLVKSVATKADLQSMPKNVYILKAVDQTVKVVAGK